MSNPGPAHEPPDAERKPATDFSANPIREDVEILEAGPFPFPPGGEFPLGPLQALFRPAIEPTFHVPTRFGMSAILGITTALAVLFGLFRAFGAHEVMYLFFGLLSMIICLVQMRFGDVARQASIIAGAVMMPVFLIGATLYVERQYRGEFVCLVVFSIPLGGFLGYVTGTFAGGIFLLMDMFERYWTGKPLVDRPGGPRLDGVSGHR